MNLVSTKRFLAILTSLVDEMDIRDCYHTYESTTTGNQSYLAFETFVS